MSSALTSTLKSAVQLMGFRGIASAGLLLLSAVSLAVHVVA